MHFDYVTFTVIPLRALIDAGLFRAGFRLMHFKDESPKGLRKAWLFITLGIVFGIAALLTLLLAVMKMGLLG